MAIQICPFGNSQFLTIGGIPAAGYQLFVYEGRSTTKVVTYTDKDGNAKHTNPIILDANGFTPSPIYIDTSRAYRFVFAVDIDEDPPTAPQYVVDQVTVGLDTQTVSTAEWLAGDTPTYVAANQFSLSGDQRVTYHIGRRVNLTTGAGTLYGSISNSTFSVATTTVTVILDVGTLDVTLSAVQYSFLSATNSAWPGGRSSGLNTIFTGTVTIPLTSSFNLLPAGHVILFAGTAFPPAGFLQCNGATVSRSLYPSLFSSIGTVFGVGDGVTTFGLPNIANVLANVRYMIRYA